MENEKPIQQQTSSFKLIKTTKGYTWEIKIYHDDITVIKSKILDLDAWATEKWGFRLHEGD